MAQTRVMFYFSQNVCQHQWISTTVAITDVRDKITKRRHDPTPDVRPSQQATYHQRTETKSPKSSILRATEKNENINYCSKSTKVSSGCLHCLAEILKVWQLAQVQSTASPRQPAYWNSSVKLTDPARTLPRRGNFSQSGNFARRILR